MRTTDGRRCRTGARRGTAAGVSAAGILVAAAVTGCTGTPPAAGGPVAAPAASDVTMVPRDRVRDGGTLRRAMPDFPAQWNVHHVTGAGGTAGEILRGLLPHLMPIGEGAVPRPDPDYVTAAEVTRVGGRQTVTYTINPAARWSDGRRIGHRDFAAQVRALSGRDRRFHAASVTGYEQIGRVRRGAGPRQVVVTFRRPFADWRSLFTPLYPAAAYRRPADFEHAWTGGMPITAGPFAVEHIDRTAKTVTIRRDPNWWGRPAKLDRMVFRVLATAAMPGAFAGGEVDVLDIGADADAYRRAAAVDGAVIHRAGGPDWRHFTLNATAPILSDVRVRRAVMLGIDRSVLARSDLTGLDWPVRTMDSHFHVNSQPGYRAVAGDLGRYDPERARRLLTAAGWRQSDARHGAQRARAGRPLVLRYVVPVGVPVGLREGEVAQAMLRRIGVRLDIVPVPADQFFPRYVTAGDFDIVAFSWLGTVFPISSLRAVYAAPRGDRVQQNVARAGTPEIDRLMDAAAAELDGRRAGALIRRADRRLWRLATVLPLYQRPQLVATRSGVVNFGAWGMRSPVYPDIGFAAGVTEN